MGNRQSGRISKSTTCQASESIDFEAVNKAYEKLTGFSSKRPKNTFTVKEYAKNENISRRSASDKINLLLENELIIICGRTTRNERYFQLK